MDHHGPTPATSCSETGWRRVFGYRQQLVPTQRREPADDVISRLCATEGVSDDQAADLSTGLPVAGYESVVSQMGLGALLLLANPEQWRALAHNATLASNAVEETLRAARGFGVFPRYARTDLEIDGVTVQPGILCCSIALPPITTRRYLPTPIRSISPGGRPDI